MTDDRTMTLERFRELADAYGGDVARWPEAERRAARAFATTHETAPAILAEAAALDAALANAPTHTPSPALRSAILDGFPARAPSRAPSRLGDLGALGRWLGIAGGGAGVGGLAVMRAPALALMMTLSVGLAVGYLGGRGAVAEANAEIVLAGVFDASGADLFSLEDAS